MEDIHAFWVVTLREQLDKLALQQKDTRLARFNARDQSRQEEMDDAWRGSAVRLSFIRQSGILRGLIRCSGDGMNGCKTRIPTVVVSLILNQNSRAISSL